MDSIHLYKIQAKRTDMKAWFILLLYTRSTPQPQRQTLSQKKMVGKWFFQSNGPKKQAGVAILISNKIDFKLKSIRRDGEGHFTLITDIIHQDKVSIPNICDPNTRALTYVKETLLKLKSHVKTSHTNSRRFQHPTLHSGQPDRKLTEKELTDVMSQMNLTDIYRIFRPNTSNILSSQNFMEPSLKFPTYLVTKQTSTNTKKLE